MIVVLTNTEAGERMWHDTAVVITMLLYKLFNSSIEIEDAMRRLNAKLITYNESGVLDLIQRAQH